MGEVLYVSVAAKLRFYYLKWSRCVSAEGLKASFSMRSETNQNTHIEGAATDRAAWSTPRLTVVSVGERTEGAFIPGPAEIPSLCS